MSEHGEMYTQTIKLKSKEALYDDWKKIDRAMTWPTDLLTSQHDTQTPHVMCLIHIICFLNSNTVNNNKHEVCLVNMC